MKNKNSPDRHVFNLTCWNEAFNFFSFFDIFVGMPYINQLLSGSNQLYEPTNIKTFPNVL